MGLRDGDHLDILVDDGRIVLSKREDSCVFCSSPADLKEFKERMVCASCLTELTSGDVQPWEPFSPE